MMLPSKELLSEILCMYGINLIIFDENTNEINYTTFASIVRGIRDENINIYELAHKCKEWAFNNYHFVLASRVYKGSSVIIEETIGTGMGGGKRMVQQFIETTEPEAIFKACQWILDNKDRK